MVCYSYCLLGCSLMRNWVRSSCLLFISIGSCREFRVSMTRDYQKRYAKLFVVLNSILGVDGLKRLGGKFTLN